MCLVLFSALPCLAISGSASVVESFSGVEQRTGDYGMMMDEHVIRFLVPFSKTYYFLDKATQRGFTYEAIKLFETSINKRLKKGHIKIKAIIIPTRRDQLLPNLVAGIGDVAAGNLTITQERLKTVDFADPAVFDVSEVVVTRSGELELKSLFDLAGKEIYVRKSSSYYESLVHLNKTFKATGKQQIIINPADEFLEDEDLLEMVNAGLLPMIVMDNHKAAFWAQVFEGIKVHENIAINKGGQIAWAIRKNSPLLKKEINSFVKKNKQGSLHFNILLKRYLKDTKYVTNNRSKKEMEKFYQVLGLFQKYGNQYSFDWIMLAALAYQESKIDQSKRSNAGAVGIMQILPSTAADKNVAIPNIENIDPNIHAGTKYLRFMTDRYYAREDMTNIDKYLFAFASYNAGPAKIARLRKEAETKGFNPNAWFNNVEVIAARRIGRETVQYVSNIYKYYIAYKMIVQTMLEKEAKTRALKPSS